MSERDWHDPFADDEAARARAQRRTERAERRAHRAAQLREEQRRQALAERVRTSRDEAAGEARRAAPRSDGDGGASALPPPRPPAAAPASPPDPPADEDDAAGREPPPTPGPPGRRPAGRGALWRRRLIAAFAIAVLAFVALVVVVLAWRGSEEPAPPPRQKPVKTMSVTIPEGYSRDQIAPIAEKADLKGDYEQASEDVKGFDLAKYEAQDAQNLEGFLFPATYELFEDARAADLVKKQLDAFEEQIAAVDMDYARSKNLTTYDVLKIASMVEREIQVPEERPKAAAVIYNRLAAGMPLQIDATVRYAIGNDFSRSLTESDLQTDSPYNTYVNPGLPPGPIGNPGLASIEAAANPASASYLFYVVKPGTCGEHFFTDSEAEFNAAVARYREAQAAAGGSPTEC